MLSELIKNASVLVALFPIYSLLNPKIRKGDLLSKLLTGLLFGLIAVVAMLMPFHYATGVVYDGRSIVMVMAGLFGGGTIGLISAMIATIYRIIMGGIGVWAGSATIIGTMLLGLGFRRLLKNRPSQLKLPALFGIGLITHIFMLACQLLVFPWPTGIQIIEGIWLVVLMVFPLATVLVGVILRREDRYFEAVRDLEDNYGRYLALVESSLDGFWRADRQGKILEVNSAYCQMTGYTEQEILTKHISDLDVIEDPGINAEHIRMVFDEGSDRFETLHRRKNGEVFPAEISVAYSSEMGDSFFVFIRDLTEITKLHQQLRDKNALLSESQKLAHLGSWELDVHTEELTWSDEVYEIFGISHEEFNGTLDGFLELVHPEDREMLNSAFLDSVHQREESYEIMHRLVRKDNGKVRIVYEKSRHEKDDEGNVVRSIGMVHDITEQTQTLDKLQSLTNRYQAILNAVPDIIAEVDEKKIYTWVNRAGKEFFGEDVIGKEAKDYFIGKQNTYKKVDSLFAGKPGPVYVESWQRRIDQEHRLLGWWSTTLKNANGDVIGALSTGRDITEVMQDKRKIEKLNVELEQRVRSRTAELEAANEDLRIFSYSISHDLRAPLRGINGFSEILARRHKQSLNEEGQEYLGYIIQAGQQMNTLIEDLLGYGRLGVSAVKSTKINCHQIVDRVLQMLSAEIEERQAEIIFPDEFPSLYSDPVLMEHIMYNFIDNAMKFQPIGQTPQVRMTCEVNGDKMKLTVSDNGIGIPSKYLTKIFTPFQRLHSQDEYIGTGMGLAIVKKCTELMGGEVGVSSNSGEGSDFWVVLPISQEEE